MRLIDADALKKLRDDYIQGRIKFDGNENDLIDICPTVDAEPVRHGIWIEEKLVGCEPYYLCSLCGKLHHQNYNFCNNCGAKMDKGE